MSDTPQDVFRTHANYVDAFHRILNRRSAISNEPLSSHVYRRVIASEVCRCDRRTDIDATALKKSLSNAWGIETLLYANLHAAEDDAVIRLANNWSCIQVYYILYHCTQALMVAKGHPRPESHPKTQNSFVNLWADRNVELGPWTLAFDESGVRNHPKDVIIEHSIHPWSSCHASSCWSLAAKALKTTRSEFYDEALYEARKRKRRERTRLWESEESERLKAGRRCRKRPEFPLPILSPAEKQKIALDLRAYSIFDYLYRLRIKTNYLDSDMFIDGPIDEQQSEVLARQLCEIASSTLLLTEVYLMHIWGKPDFIAFRKEWQTSRKKAFIVEQSFPRDSLLITHSIA